MPVEKYTSQPVKCEVCGKPAGLYLITCFHEEHGRSKPCPPLCLDHHREVVDLRQKRILDQLKDDIDATRRSWALSQHTCTTVNKCQMVEAHDADIGEDGQPVIYCREFMTLIKQGGAPSCRMYSPPEMRKGGPNGR